MLHTNAFGKSKANFFFTIFLQKKTKNTKEKEKEIINENQNNLSLDKVTVGKFFERGKFSSNEQLKYKVKKIHQT